MSPVSCDWMILGVRTNKTGQSRQSSLRGDWSISVLELLMEVSENDGPT